MWDIGIDRVNLTRMPVLQVTGELNRHTQGLLRSMLSGVLAEGHRRAGVDLEHLGCLDEAGVSALRWASGRFHERGGELVIQGAEGRVERVLGQPWISPIP